MKDEEIRLEIAESVGWQWWKFHDKFHDSNTEPFYVIAPGDSNWPERQSGIKCGRPSEVSEKLDNDVPRYTEDLNAINDVCRSKWNILSGWSMEMRRIVCRDDVDKEIDGERLPDLWFYCATARQRCEGYLRTIGKWRDA